MKGYPYWPALICPPPAGIADKGPSYVHVVFFGTAERAFILKDLTKDYLMNYSELKNKNGKKFNDALEMASEFLMEIVQASDILTQMGNDWRKKEKYLLDVFFLLWGRKYSQKVKRQRRTVKYDPIHAGKVSKKPKMSSAENTRKERKLKTKELQGPKTALKDSINGKISKKPKMSPAKDTRKETKLTSSTNAMKGIPKENVKKSSKALKKPKTVASAEGLKKAPKKPKTVYYSKGIKRIPEKVKTVFRAKLLIKGKKKRTLESVEYIKKMPKFTLKAETSKKVDPKKRTPKGNPMKSKRASWKTSLNPNIRLKTTQIRYMNPDFLTAQGSAGSSSDSEYGSYKEKVCFIKGPMQPVPLNLGFVGIGQLGMSLVTQLLKVGQRVTIWNRSRNKCAELVQRGARLARSPEELAEKCDIVFCTVKGIRAITEACFGGLYVTGGIVKGLQKNTKPNKGFVILSSVLPETSMIIAQDFRKVCARYLEAQVIIKSQDNDCNICVLCSGSRELFDSLPNIFACSRAQFIFLNSMLGDAARMKYAYTITQLGFMLALIEAVAIFREGENPMDNLFFLLEELEGFPPATLNKVRAILLNKLNVGSKIKHLKENLEELMEWYPKRQLRLSRALNEALDSPLMEGTDDYGIVALYRLIS